MEVVFNKLVRDKIPNMIRSNGETPVIKLLDDKEYQAELYKKLVEEAQEVTISRNQSDTLEELADVLEALNAIAILNCKSIEDIIEIANDKRKKRGGFSERIFLEKKYTDEM